MKRIVVLCSLLLSCASLLALPSFDPFADATASGGSSYANGAVLWGQTNAAGEIWWGLNNTGTGPAVVMTNINLTYPGLPASSGNGVLIKSSSAAGPSAGINIGAHAAATSNTLYYSCLIKLPDIGTLSTTFGAFCMAFNNTTRTANGSGAATPVDDHGILFILKTNTSPTPQYLLGVGKSTGGTFTTRIFDFNTYLGTNDTVFVVVEYEIVGGPTSGTDDICRLWINPSSSTFATTSYPTPNATTATATATEPDAITLNSFMVMNRNSSLPTTMIMDELRLGTTWAYVTGGSEFTLQPTSAQSPALGSTVNISAIAKSSDGTTPIYKWKRNGVNLTDGSQAGGSTVAGSATTNLTITAVGGNDSGTYTCMASNTVYGVSSSSSVLVVADPYIVTQPVAAQALQPGATANMSVSVLGTPPVTYQWNNHSGALTDNGHFVGSTTSNLSVVNISFGDADSYYCVITSGVGTATTANSVLTISDPAFTVPPVSTTNLFGTNAYFTVGVTGTGPFTYRWQRNFQDLTDGTSTSGTGSIISGSGTSALTISGIAFADDASFSVNVTNSVGGSSIGQPVTLTVVDPIITMQPTNVSIVAGSQASFTVGVAGSQPNGFPIFYQWRKGSTKLSNGANISGSTTTNLTIINAQASDAGSYNLQVNGADGTTNFSSNAILSITVPVSIVSPPLNRTQRVGENTAFAVGAAGSGLTYSWTKDGGSVISTNFSVVVNNIQLSDSGTYQVVVGGTVGSATSSATLTVVTNMIHLSTNRLVISRVGDGAQILNRSTISPLGNTLYIDQYDTNGNYYASTMIPNNLASNSQALIVDGQDTTSGAVGLIESVLGVSPNNRYLGFGGYNVTWPYTSNALDAATSANAPRCGGVINGLGYYAMTWRSTNAFNGSPIRGCMPDSTGNNFWVANGTGVHYVSGSANVTMNNSNAVSNDRLIQGFTNTTTHTYDLYVCSASTTNSGLYKFPGTAITATNFTVLFTNAGVNLNNEFAISPDGLTAYIAQGGINANTGSLARFDNSGGTWLNSYNFTVPSRSVLVDWSGFTGGGVNGAGAVLYVTTAETNNNRLLSITDNNSSSPTNLLATAGTNTLFRSVRFGVPADPPSIGAQPVTQSVTSGSGATLSVTPSGSAPFTFQWYFGGNPISGATNSSLSFSSVQLTNAGSYFVVVSNELNSATSSTAVLTVLSQPSLSISSAGTNVVLSWLAVYTNFTLQGLVDLTTTNWTTAGTPTVVGANNQVTNPNAGVSKFYRLKH